MKVRTIGIILILCLSVAILPVGYLSVGANTGTLISQAEAVNETLPIEGGAIINVDAYVFGEGCERYSQFAAGGEGYLQSPFATEVVDFSGPFGNDPYDDPASVLGKPTCVLADGYHVSMVYSAWNRDDKGNKTIVTLKAGAYITVKFDHRVEDDPHNPYGIDFIVFGNSFYEGKEGNLTKDTDMEHYHIKTGVPFAEPVRVSISQDGTTWYDYDSPTADDNYPTNSYKWNRTTHDWGEELDFTKPVDPSIDSTVFKDKSVADVIDQYYKGSAGGTGFDLAPSGYSWVQYVKVSHGGDDDGEIDAFADVKAFIDTPAPPTNLDAELSGTDLENITLTWTLSKDDGNGTEDVKNYAIYRNTSYSKNGIGYIFLAEVANGTSYYIDVNAGDGNSNNYFYYVQANDTSDNTNWTDQAGKIAKECVLGWNFISDPYLDLDGADITTVLRTLEWDIVRWYDPLAAEDHWVSYSTNKPSGFNDFIKMNRTMGIWVNVTIGGDCFVDAGRVYGSTAIQLYTGYNFVSYASFIDRTVGDALSGIPYEQVEGFDETNSPYYLNVLADADVMTAGNGYWIRVSDDCVWTVEN